MHGKRIESMAELRKICDASEGVIVIPSSKGSTVHMPACRIIDELTPLGCSDTAVRDWNWHASVCDAVQAAPSPPAHCPECNPGSDGKTSALNKSGTFLHAEIYRVLKSSGYHTDAEHPVRVAPFVQDPLKRPRALVEEEHPTDPLSITVTVTSEFQRAVAESQHTGLAKERVLDIVATARIVGTLELVLPIEVKKVDPYYVDWVFVNYNTDKIDMTTTTISPVDLGGPMLFKIPPSDMGRPPLHVEKGTIKTTQVCLDVYDGAVPLTLKNGSRYEFQNRALNNAATQVVEGTFGLITDKITHKVSTGIQSSTRQCYIPIVVTTANLYSCSYNPVDFEVSSGTVSKACLKKEEFLIYECPTPATVAFPHQLTYLDRRKNIRSLTKWHVVVTQAQSFEKMLNLLRGVVLDGGRVARFWPST